MKRKNENPRDEVRELLAEAGPPPRIPGEDLAPIRAAARAEWRRRYGGRGGAPARDYRPLFALAASLLMALAVGWWWMRQSPPDSREIVATVELVRGNARLDDGAGAGDPALQASPAEGDPVASGSTLRTSTGLLAVRLPGGQSIRLAAGTEASLVSASRLELRRGAVYVDSGPATSGSVEISTPLGLVTEIGTQFEVRVGNGDSETVRVRVREGSVSLAHDGRSYSATPGQQLTIDSRGEVFRAAVPVRGEEWSWILDAAPSMEIEGRSLLSYLHWVARETGWEIQYAEARLEQAASTIVLHGSIEGLTPQQSLEPLLSGSGLTYEVRDGTLLVAGPSRPQGAAS